MIEFELKFCIFEIPFGLSCLKIKNKITESDNYFDTNDNLLIKNGNFFRIRNDKNVDFKLYVGDDFHMCCKETSFKKSDIVSDNTEFINIFRYLGIQINTKFSSFEEFIVKNKFWLIAPIVKERCIYTLDDDITLTVDDVNGLGRFIEVEMMLSENTNLDNKMEIRDNLLQTLKKRNIYDDSFSEINIGYVELYLKENNSEIYELGKFKSGKERNAVV